MSGEYNEEEVKSIISEIRESDSGEWLKDCQTQLFTCREGREKRFELMRLLNKLYYAAGLSA